MTKVKQIALKHDSLYLHWVYTKYVMFSRYLTYDVFQVQVYLDALGKTFIIGDETLHGVYYVTL